MILILLNSCRQQEDEVFSYEDYEDLKAMKKSTNNTNIESDTLQYNYNILSPEDTDPAGPPPRK